MKGYQLKITIKESRPPIWRRVIVPERITFADLDEIIEKIFGWTHEHLYEFYFPSVDARFTLDPDSDEDTDDVHTQFIDEWMWADSRFRYIYDFGDYWEHTICVEKIVNYEYRYPIVLKSKGPYMIEDCGGIYDFYTVFDDAEAFDLESANHELEKCVFKIPESDKEKISYAELDNYFEQYLEESSREQQLAKKIIAENYDNFKISTLEEIFFHYSKEGLKLIAKHHKFTKYSSLKKAELTKWLSNHLLETSYMKRMLENTSEEEIETFDDAMHRSVIWVPESLIADSFFLSTYGAYNQFGIYYIPDDVQKKYTELMTAGFRKKLKRKWRLACYTESACFLYGIITLDKFTEIVNFYEKDTYSRKEIQELLTALEKTYVCEFTLEDDLLIAEELLENNLYKKLLDAQGDIPFYVPDDESEFIAYGEFNFEDPNEYTQRFILYLQNTYNLTEDDAIEIFYTLQDAIHSGYPSEALLDILKELLNLHEKKIVGGKRIDKAIDELQKLMQNTRLLVLRGHTVAEIQRKEEEKRLDRSAAVQDTSNKIIPFNSKKKIYPNDLCPCGSGKKYKNCCKNKER